MQFDPMSNTTSNPGGIPELDLNLQQPYKSSALAAGHPINCPKGHWKVGEIGGPESQCLSHLVHIRVLLKFSCRSEERRVGKECT